MNNIESLDLEVREVMKKAETDSSIKNIIERTMGASKYSKTLFYILGRRYLIGDFTRMRNTLYEITGIQLKEVSDTVKKTAVIGNWPISDGLRDYLICEEYAILISGKRKVINNE